MPLPTETPRSILIVKLSAIGDTLHAVPAVAALREAFPAATITWCVEKRCATLVRCLACVDRVLELDTRSWRRGRKLRGEGGLVPFLRDLRATRADVAFDFQGLLKSAAVTRLSGAPLRIGWARPLLREKAAVAGYNHRVGEVPPHTHVIEICSRLLSPLGIDTAPRRFPFRFPGEASRRAGEMLGALGPRPFVILNPGGGWPTKRWAPERFGALALRVDRELGLTPVVTLGPGEEPLAEAVRRTAPSTRVLAPGLPEFALLCGKAAAVVAGDTGPMHLASAAGAPVVGIFGPTDPRRNGPFGERAVVVSRGLPCQGCHHRKCSDGRCMDIPVEDVYNGLLACLGPPPGHAAKG
ncbi:MAG: glycosyltransferase family 9 protein [Acidobacteria bacterium]|nr:glycosyltransferase family 9 protein [Acidobacteriota bacterium]